MAMQSFPAATLLASVPFMLSMGFTPGPNNIMVASSGVNFGFRATVPHILGVSVGFPMMFLVVGLGLAKLFIALPWVHTVLKWVSIAYILYLAWRVAGASAMDTAGSAPKPLTFLQAAAFQWVNVKAWITSLSVVTTYSVVNATLPLQIGTLAVISMAVTIGSVSCWTLFGHFLRDFLDTGTRRRVFNGGMGLLLLVSVLPVFWE